MAVDVVPGSRISVGELIGRHTYNIAIPLVRFVQCFGEIASHCVVAIPESCRRGQLWAWVSRQRV
jgi:hypothetical protein